MAKQISLLGEKFSLLIDKIFLLLFGSYVVVGTLRTTSIEYKLIPFFTAWIAVGLFAIIASKFFLLHLYAAKELALYSAVFVTVLLVVLRNHHDTLMMLLLLIIASKGIDFSKIVAIQLIAVAEVLIFSAVLSQTGISADFGGSHFSSPFKTFGVCSTTDFASYILFLILNYSFLRGKRITFGELLLFGVTDVWVYKQTEAKTAFLALLIFCCMAALNKLMLRFSVDPTKWRIVTLGMVAMPLLSLMMLVLSLVYSERNALIKRIDIFFTHRIMLGHMGIEHYGVNLLGTEVIEHGYGFGARPDSYFFLDSSYMRLFLIDGLLVYFVVMLMYLSIFKKMIADKNGIGMIVFFVLAITCLTEHHLLEPWYNTVTLLYLAVLIPKKEDA